MKMTPITVKIARILSRIEGVAVSDLMAACPFRTFIAPGPLAGLSTEAMSEYAGSVFVLLELEPVAIHPLRMREIQETLLAGETVLLLAAVREVRDHARREILAWYDAVKGAVQ